MARERAQLRAWSVGCASGEEPYSLAIAWSRIDPALREGRSLAILGADLDLVVLERAREGIYDRRSLRDLPPAALYEAFDELGDGRVRLRSAWRRGVELRCADLLVDELPENVDLVLCRYLVLTYYRGRRLGAALDRLERATAPYGLVVFGRKETVPPEARERLRRWRRDVPCVYRFAGSDPR
jgi:chemotaxis protein methyltransferase CheR